MYYAYVLNEESRNQILKNIGHHFNDVICHHITYAFGVNTDFIPPTAPNSIKIIGWRLDTDLHVECLVVSIDGNIKRPDGKIFHITLSLDKSKGAKPVDSNKALEKKWVQIKSPFEINAIGKLLK